MIESLIHTHGVKYTIFLLLKPRPQRSFIIPVFFPVTKVEYAIYNYYRIFRMQ